MTAGSSAPERAGPGRVVVVGAGIAGLRTAETLRRERFTGPITLVGGEPHPAYDRPALSKEVISSGRDPVGTYLRPLERYRDLGIELVLDRPATGLDTDRRRVLLDDDELAYDTLVIATGVAARRIPGWAEPDQPAVLRTLEDAVRLQAALADARHLTVVGAGFIGAEVAAGARERGIAVTLLEREQAPLARSLGPEIAAALMDLHRAHGTDVRLGVTLASPPADGAVRLTDGSVLSTDLVIAGIGVVPEIGWLQGSGLTLGDGVVCDATLRAAPGVYAVGDVANWPNPLFDRRMRVEHWTNASQQASAAARTIARGTQTPFAGAGYVWSDQYGVRIQLAGRTTDAEAVVVAGRLAEHDALVWYRHEDRLVGALAMGRPRAGLQSVPLIEARTPWDEALTVAKDWA